MSPQKRKRKPFRASKEVKRQARMRIGTPPPEKTHPDIRRKPPKHKQPDLDEL